MLCWTQWYVTNCNLAFYPYSGKLHFMPTIQYTLFSYLFFLCTIQLLSNLSLFFSAMIAQITVATTVWMLRLAYLSLFKPPTPKDCGSADGLPVTSPRVQLSDGRYLAYKQGGVPRRSQSTTPLLFMASIVPKTWCYQYPKHENFYNSIFSVFNLVSIMYIMSKSACTCNAVETQENLAESNL